MKKADRQKVYEKYNGKCAYCGADLEYKDMQVDHIVPKLHGGANKLENYNPSCRMCNFYKSTFTLEGFRGNLETLINRVQEPFIYRLASNYGMVKETEWDGKFYFERFLEE